MQFSTFRKIACQFYGEKCTAKQTRVKIEVVKKAEKESRFTIVPSKHNERFDFFSVWFINVTKFF